MDLTSILGLVLGIVLIINGITIDKLGNFVDIPSVVIVLGGVVAAVVASYPFTILKNIPKMILVLIKGKDFRIPPLVDQLVDLASIARQEGLLALEPKAEEIKSPFLKRGLMLIVDANDPDKVREILEMEVDALAQRHEEAAGLFEKASAYAPAFGMIGTLVGLINMLKGMDLSGGENSTIGADMSVALITTFYGCVLANLIFIPLAKKLRVRNEEELLYCSIAVEGLIAIQSGESPKALRERMLSMLQRSQSRKLLAKSEKAEGEAGA